MSLKNLLVRLRDYPDDVLRFLTDFTDPFTNNQAKQEQAAHDEGATSVNGAFRTLEGSRSSLMLGPSARKDLCIMSKNAHMFPI